jgi:hypothetical protein
MENIKFNDYLELMANASSEKEKALINAQFETYFNTLTKGDISSLLSSKEQELRAELALLKEQANTTIIHNGNEYPLSDWITIKNYCTLHHLKESTVSNRIRRGALPSNAYLELPYLNNLKLIQKNYVWS